MFNHYFTHCLDNFIISHIILLQALHNRMLRGHKYQYFITLCSLENFQVCDMSMHLKIKYAVKKDTFI